jgi:hypothetical protein
MDVTSSVAFFDRRPHHALAAARKGISKIPSRHPLAVRLRGKAARAHARLGDGQRCEDLLTEARGLYDRQPVGTPLRFEGDIGPSFALQALSTISASASIMLEDFERAKARAEEALAVPRVYPAADAYWETIARIDRGIALAALGSPDEAVAEGRRALASPRVVDSVLSRAGDLDSTLTARYPDLPEARHYHEQYRETAKTRALQSV